jgi:type III secretory pathway component EscU
VGVENLRLTREEIQRHNEDTEVDVEINRRRERRHFETDHFGI